MADYYAILNKALDALPENTGEARRDVYEKARKALVSQLKSFDPPLPPAAITSQRLTLEEAIRKVEAEAARASLSARKPATPPPPSPSTPSKAEKQTTGAKTDAPSASAQPKPTQEPNVAGSHDADKPAAEPSAPTQSSGTVETTPSSQADTPGAPQKGVDIFRRAVAEADTLGSASSEATRAAREVLDAAEEDGRQAERREPEFSGEPEFEAADAPADQDVGYAEGEQPVEEDYGEPVPPPPLSTRTMWLVASFFLLLMVAGAVAFVYLRYDELFVADAPSKPVKETPAVVASETTTTPSNGDLAPKITDRLPSAGNGNGALSDARTVRTTRVVAPTSEQPPAGAAAPEPTSEPPAETPSQPESEAEAQPRVIAINEPPADAPAAEQPAASEEPAPTEEPSAPAGTVETPPPSADGTDTQTAAAPPAEAPSTTPASSSDSNAVLVGQRAILYEEGQQGSSGNKAYIGNVTWKIEEEPANAGSGTDAVLIAHAEIPEKGVSIDIKIRPNRDNALPASHWIEVGFDLPNEFGDKGIANVPGLIMKTTEQARGDALRGASARVLDNLFWIALSERDEEMQRNEALLKERGWIDIPVLYESNKRAILTLEKGGPGDEMIEEAFKRWNAG